MQKRKGLLLGSILCSMALLISACGSSDDDNASDNNTNTTAANSGGITDRNIKIAFSAPGADHGWTAAITTMARAEAAKHKDVDFNLLEGTNDAAAQVAQVEALISQKPDVLVILPQDGAALTPVALKAMQAGIQVVSVDREFTDTAAFRTLIKGDNYGAGLQAGQYFAKTLNCKGDVVEIQGLAGISVTNQRSQGFRDGIKACNGGIRIIASQPADFDPAKGLTVMETILQANKKIDAVYTHDDDMAEGVVQAIKNAGRDKEMWLTGVGGSKKAMEAIEQGGLYRATFLYNPSMAASAVNLARLIGLNKGLSDLTEPSVPNQIVVTSAGVFKENVNQYKSLGF
jgi:ribose transport system substrate-binding protein